MNGEDAKLDDLQTRLLMLLLLSVVTAAVALGFIRALLTGTVAIGYANPGTSEVVRRADQPGRYWRLMAVWALMLALCLGLLAIPVLMM